MNTLSRARRYAPLIAIILLAICSTTLFGALPEVAADDDAASMTLIQAIILGIVEGVTEYIPISSTGHILLAQRAMGMSNSDAANAYAICIQAGAILAVLGLYWSHIKRMFMGLLGKNAAGLRLAINILVAFLPAAAVGLLLLDTIQRHLFGMWPIVIAWFIGGVAILAVAKKKRLSVPTIGASLDTLTCKQAFVIGLIQCFAIWPGTSRSLVTIIGGVLVGLNLMSSVVFSFLLGALTLLAVSAYAYVHVGGQMLEAFGAVSMLTGCAVATVSAIAAVKWMLHYIQRSGLALFGYYRIVLGLVVAGLILTGTMSGK